LKKPVLSQAAERELLEAKYWYSQRGPLLADRFLEDFNATAERVWQHPLAYSAIRKRLRRANFLTFPYYLLFREISGQIEVIAVAHASRNPGYWQDRFPEV
jgi:plasmid stabilization system protein ParE